MVRMAADLTAHRPSAAKRQSVAGASVQVHVRSALLAKYFG